ncbi:MAG: hypothetical protein HY360_20885 [Verrucomicrobia bacterium]|nr:hypothetical protein [Verrucomicrobiota bacterium]
MPPFRKCWRAIRNCHYGNGGYHNWRRKKGNSGTWFIEKATHDFDVMNWLVDATPATIAAVSRLQAFGGDKPADLRPGIQKMPFKVVVPGPLAKLLSRRRTGGDSFPCS